MYENFKKRTYIFRGVYYIPARMMDPIRNYIVNGDKPGDFLTAVIKNNLREACASADDENLQNLPAYVAFFYNEAPAECWGSPEIMKGWMACKKTQREAGIMALTDDIIDVALYVKETAREDFEGQIFPGSKAMEPYFDSEDDNLEILIAKFAKKKSKKLTEEIGFRTNGHIYSKAVRVLDMLNK